MTSNFFINNVFDENLEFSFSVNDGNFTTLNQYYILQHSEPIKNLKKLTCYSDIIIIRNKNFFFKKEYRYSFDNTNYSEWLQLFDNFNNFPDNLIDLSTNNNIYLQFKYTLKETNISIPDNTIKASLKELTVNGKREFTQSLSATDCPALCEDDKLFGNDIILVNPSIGNGGTVKITDTNGTIIEVESGGEFTCTINEITIINSDNTFILVSNNNITLPDITIKNSNESVNILYPSAKNYIIPDTNLTNSDSSNILIIPSADNFTLPDITIQNTNATFNTVYPSIKNYTIPDTILINSDATFNINVPSITQYTLPDITIQNTNGTFNILYPGVKNYIIPNTNLTNTDNTFNVSVPSVDNYTIPNTNITNSSNDFNVSVPSVSEYTLPDTNYQVFINGVLSSSFSLPTLGDNIVNINYVL